MTFAVGFSFGSQIDLSDDPGDSRDSQIVAIGNNVYVVFRSSSAAGANNILFTNSTDGGANFDSAIDLSESGVLSETPQLSVSGNSVYVVWKEVNDIVLRNSTNNGDTFDFPAETLSSGLASAPQLSATGNNVYVTFQDGKDFIINYGLEAQRVE